MCYPTQLGCTADVKQWAYDPAKAKALLAEARYAKGLKIPYYAYRDRPYSEAVLAYLRNADLPLGVVAALRPNTLIDCVAAETRASCR